MKTKNLIKFSFVLVLMFIVGRVLAQTIDPPEDIVDLIANFDTFIASLAGYAAVSVFLTGLLNGWFKITKSWIKQVVSWAIPVILTVIVSYVFKAGFLAEEGFVKVILFGLGAGLVSNGIFDISFVNTFINWIVPKLGGTVGK